MSASENARIVRKALAGYVVVPDSAPLAKMREKPLAALDALLVEHEIAIATLREERDELEQRWRGMRDCYDREVLRGGKAEERAEVAERRVAALTEALRGACLDLAMGDDDGAERRVALYLARVQSAADATGQKPAVECDGGPYCGATRHLHGCFNDKGNCDHPSEHRIVAADATERAG